MARDLYIRPSEVELLRQALADGMTTREAAEHIGRSLSTVTRLMRRHGLKSRNLRIGVERKDPNGERWVTTRLGITRRR